MQGQAADLSKAFDNIPVRITFAILERLGMEQKLMNGLRAMYNQMKRRFKLGQYVGEAFVSTNGILHGCPISVMLLNAIMMALHEAIEVNGELVAESFVDDLTFLSNSQSTMLRSKTCVVSPTGSGAQNLLSINVNSYAAHF